MYTAQLLPISDSPQSSIPSFNSASYVNYLDLIRFSKYKLEIPVVFVVHDTDSIQNFLAAKNQKREPFIGFGSNISQEIQLLSCVDKMLCISNDEKCFFIVWLIIP